PRSPLPERLPPIACPHPVRKTGLLYVFLTAPAGQRAHYLPSLPAPRLVEHAPLRFRIPGSAQKHGRISLPASDPLLDRPFHRLALRLFLPKPPVLSPPHHSLYIVVKGSLILDKDRVFGELPNRPY